MITWMNCNLIITIIVIHPCLLRFAISLTSAQFLLTKTKKSSSICSDIFSKTTTKPEN